MNTAHQDPAPAAASDMPRNAERLAARAQAGGWTVTPTITPQAVTLRLTATVRAGRGTGRLALECTWRATGQGPLRWEGATLQRDGQKARTQFGWPEVAPLLANLAPAMVDPAAEASGTTRHGRSAQEWREDLAAQAKTAREAKERAQVARGRVRQVRYPQGPGGPVNGWADAADRAALPIYSGLERREYRVSLLPHRVGADADARRLFDVAERARVLAEACVKDAAAVEAVLLAHEAEEVCAPLVAEEAAVMVAEEAAWRAANPDGGPARFAREVIGTFGGADGPFAEWWEENAEPGMTYYQGWDARDPHRMPRAELNLSLRLDAEVNRALFALGSAAAAVARARGGEEGEARAVRLAAEAQRGAALYAPGARRGRGEGGKAALAVWSLLECGRWGMSLDMAENVRAVEMWTKTAARREAWEVRRLFLARHCLDVREDARREVREQLAEAERERGRVARGVFDQAQAAGASEAEAREVMWDVRARLDAEAAGRAADGRERFGRGGAVWVEPEPHGGGRYVGTVACYLGRGLFRVRREAAGWEAFEDVPSGRMAPASPKEAVEDRARQLRAKEREEQERAVELQRRAEEQERQAEAERVRAAEHRHLCERKAARATTRRGMQAPTAPGKVWAPVHRVPDSVEELWILAAEYGWAMDRETLFEGRTIVVRIVGTTSRGRWAFRLVWRAGGGRYAVEKSQSDALWADRRQGPRGGKVRPTVGDVRDVIVRSGETLEGAAAPLGQLVTAADVLRKPDGPGRPVTG
ncbi:hypothetical protein [Kitasatospora sp. NPDC093679]|uniref:hypothetical protein n=1 Tax=Kitasatospora sp. NPDC093679 TaxID=3154983 RepID=UPI003427484E